MVGITSTIWEIDPHTKAKHDILEEYLKQWFPIVSSTAERVVFLDGFAGPGIYSKGEEGSPIVAIKTALEHKFFGNFKKIIFWFIEKDKDRAETLRDVLKDRFTLPEKFLCEVEKSEFASSLENTLDSIEKEGAKLAPTLAFIDPFGFSGMPMNLISRILGYKRCEVLITFMSSFILRFNDKEREGALDELFGTTDWRKIRDITEPDEKRRFVVDLYIRQLRLLGGAKFFRTFEMIGDNNQLIYHLVFATKSLTGLRAMKEAMMRVDRRGTFSFSDRTDPNQTFLLDYSENKNWVPQASVIAFNKFHGKTVTVEEVEQFILVETPYVFRKSILQDLELKGKITDVKGRTKKGSFPKGCIIKFSN